MSENSPDNGWQKATGRKRKRQPKPAAEAEQSASRSHIPVVEPATSSPNLSEPAAQAGQSAPPSRVPAAEPQTSSHNLPKAQAEQSASSFRVLAVEPEASSHDISLAEPPASESTDQSVQQTTLPIIVSSPEQSQAPHHTIPERSSPRKSGPSSLSSSPDKAYLSAHQSPVGSDMPGNGGSSGEEAYLSATEHIEDPPSDVENLQASNEKIHPGSQGPPDDNNQSKGKETEIREELALATAESLPYSPDFLTEFLSFPEPVFESKGREENSNSDHSSKSRQQNIEVGDTAISLEALPLQSALSPENQVEEEEKETGFEQTTGKTQEKTEGKKIQGEAAEQLEPGQEEKAETEEAATSTADENTPPGTDSIQVQDSPQVVRSESSSRGDVDTELSTNRAMTSLRLSNQQPTSRLDTAPEPTHPATMAPNKSSSSLSAKAADFVPMPTIDEASTPPSPLALAEQAAAEAITSTSEMAPELPRFASLAEQRLRANNPSHPANAATEFLSAPELPRPLAPRSALASSPSPPSGNQPLALYDNETPGIPSHWIPLYGATHGMFYDPFTKMFMNDGAPRPTVHRTDGTTPCASNEGVAAAAAAHPVGNIEDALHVQRSTLTTPHLDRPYAPANNQYYCWCTGRWLSSPHNCALDASVVPAGAGAPIRPGTVLPANWVTHVAPIRDTSYVERMGLSSQLDAQIDSAVQEALLEMANEPDEPVEAPTTRASRPLSMADLAAAGFPMPTRRPARQPTAPPAPSTTGEALAPRDIGTSVPDNRQARRAAAKEAEKAAKKAGLARGGRGGGRGGQGSSRGGRGGGGAGAGQWIAAS